MNLLPIVLGSLHKPCFDIVFIMDFNWLRWCWGRYLSEISQHILFICKTLGGHSVLQKSTNGECYLQQFIKLKRAFAEKRREFATRHEAIIFHHDNARPHVAMSVKNYLETSLTRFIVQTVPLLTTIYSGQCRMPSLEYGSHQKRISKILKKLKYKLDGILLYTFFKIIFQFLKKQYRTARVYL